MEKYVLFQGVLNDDTIEICDEGKCFNLPKHPTVRVTYWTYANEWSNRKHVFYACSVENAVKRYKRETKRVPEFEYLDLILC